MFVVVTLYMYSTCRDRKYANRLMDDAMFCAVPMGCDKEGMGAGTNECDSISGVW